MSEKSKNLGNFSWAKELGGFHAGGYDPALLKHSPDEAGLSERHRSIREDFKRLLGPLVPALLRNSEGALDVSRIKVKSREEFFKFLQTQAELNDHTSFSDPYQRLLEDEEFSELLSLLYQEADPDYSVFVSADEASELLQKFQARLIEIDADHFAQSHLNSNSGRKRIQSVFSEPSHYSLDARADLAKAVARVSPDWEHFITQKISLWNYFNLGVVEEDVDHASRVAASALNAKDEKEKDYSSRHELYLKNPELVTGTVHLESSTGLKIKPSEIKAMEELRLRGLKSLDPLLQVKGKLAGLWLLAADADYFNEPLGEKPYGLNAWMIEKAERFLAKADKIESEEELQDFNEELQDFLKDGIGEPKEGESYTWVKHQLLGQGFKERFESRSPELKAPYEELVTLSDRWKYAQESGEAIFTKKTELQIEDPKLKEAVISLIQGLEQTKQELWYGYKQHKALSRGISNLANLAKSGDIADIEEANRELDHLIKKLKRAESSEDVQNQVNRFQELMKEGNALHSGFQAAEMSGSEQVLGLIQTVGTIVLVASATKGLSLLAQGGAAAARGPAALAAIRNFVTGMTALRPVQGFLWGATIATMENAIAVSTGEVRVERDTIEKWLKDALSTGASMALVMPLAKAGGQAAEQYILKDLAARYLSHGSKGALNLLSDTGLEAVEEVVDQYVRQALDGNYQALSLGEIQEITKICLAGGGLQIGALARQGGKQEVKLKVENPAEKATTVLPTIVEDRDEIEISSDPIFALAKTPVSLLATPMAFNLPLEASEPMSFYEHSVEFYSRHPYLLGVIATVAALGSITTAVLWIWDRLERKQLDAELKIDPTEVVLLSLGVVKNKQSFGSVRELALCLGLDGSLDLKKLPKQIQERLDSSNSKDRWRMTLLYPKLHPHLSIEDRGHFVDKIGDQLADSDQELATASLLGLTLLMPQIPSSDRRAAVFKMSNLLRETKNGYLGLLAELHLIQSLSKLHNSTCLELALSLEEQIKDRTAKNRERAVSVLVALIPDLLSKDRLPRYLTILNCLSDLQPNVREAASIRLEIAFSTLGMEAQSFLRGRGNGGGTSLSLLLTAGAGLATFLGSTDAQAAGQPAANEALNYLLTSCAVIVGAFALSFAGAYLWARAKFSDRTKGVAENNSKPKTSKLGRDEALTSGPMAMEVQSLMGQLTSSFMDERPLVRKKIAGFGRDAVPVLLPFLSHEHFDFRLEAILVLAELGAREAAEPIRGLLKDPMTFVRAEAALTLMEWGEIPKLEGIRALLNDGNFLVKQMGTEAAVKWQLREVVPDLWKLIEEGDTPNRRIAIGALVELGELEAVDHVRRLNDGSNDKLESATLIRALAREGGIVDLELFRRFLSVNDPALRETLVEDLAKIESEAILPDLLALLADPNPKIRSMVSSRIREFKDYADPANLILSVILEHGNLDQRAAALDHREPGASVRKEARAKTLDPVSEIVKNLASPDEKIRDRTLFDLPKRLPSIPQTDRLAVVRQVEALLSDPSHLVRRDALWVLEESVPQLQAEERLPRLQKILELIKNEEEDEPKSISIYMSAEFAILRLLPELDTRDHLALARALEDHLKNKAGKIRFVSVAILADILPYLEIEERLPRFLLLEECLRDDHPKVVGTARMHIVSAFNQLSEKDQLSIVQDPVKSQFWRGGGGATGLLLATGAGLTTLFGAADAQAATEAVVGAAGQGGVAVLAATVASLAFAGIFSGLASRGDSKDSSKSKIASRSIQPHLDRFEATLRADIEKTEVELRSLAADEGASSELDLDPDLDPLSYADSDFLKLELKKLHSRLNNVQLLSDLKKSQPQSYGKLLEAFVSSGKELFEKDRAFEGQLQELMGGEMTQQEASSASNEVALVTFLSDELHSILDADAIDRLSVEEYVNIAKDLILEDEGHLKALHSKTRELAAHKKKLEIEKKWIARGLSQDSARSLAIDCVHGDAKRIEAAILERKKTTEVFEALLSLLKAQGITGPQNEEKAAKSRGPGKGSLALLLAGGSGLATLFGVADAQAATEAVMGAASQGGLSAFGIAAASLAVAGIFGKFSGKAQAKAEQPLSKARTPYRSAGEDLSDLEILKNSLVEAKFDRLHGKMWGKLDSPQVINGVEWPQGTQIQFSGLNGGKLSLDNFVSPRDLLIQGIPCRKGHPIRFYASGKLCSANLSQEMEVEGGAYFPKGCRVKLNLNGSIMGDISNGEIAKFYLQIAQRCFEGIAGVTLAIKGAEGLYGELSGDYRLDDPFFNYLQKIATDAWLTPSLFGICAAGLVICVFNNYKLISEIRNDRRRASPVDYHKPLPVADTAEKIRIAPPAMEASDSESQEAAAEEEALSESEEKEKVKTSRR